MSTPEAVRAPQHVHDLLQRLHTESLSQEKALKQPGGIYHEIRHADKDSAAALRSKFNDVMRDKFIALDADKAALVYNFARASGATNVVEAGTSYGVSTIYLALAVGQNALDKGKVPGQARVIATENEAGKASRAREIWSEAGESVEPWIQLREGDLLETLKGDVQDVDFVLFDIWAPVALPTLQLLEPKLRSGAIIITDNITASAKGYAKFLAHIKETSGYTTTTLPYEGGLEMTVFAKS